MKTTTGTRAKTETNAVLTDGIKSVVNQAKALGYSCYVIQNRKHPTQVFGWCYVTNRKQVCMIEVHGVTNYHVAFSIKMTMVNPDGWYASSTVGIVEMSNELSKDFFDDALANGASYRWHKEKYTNKDHVLIEL